MRRRAIAAGCAALGALGLAGCGSDTLTLSQLRTRAAHACIRAAVAEHAIAAPVGPGGAGPFLHQGIRVVTAEYATLKALRPGPAAAPPYHRALDALRQELAGLRRAEAELSRADDATATMRLLQNDLLPLEREANLAFTQLQMPACVTE